MKKIPFRGTPAKAVALRDALPRGGERGVGGEALPAAPDVALVHRGHGEVRSALAAPVGPDQQLLGDHAAPVRQVRDALPLYGVGGGALVGLVAARRRAVLACLGALVDLHADAVVRAVFRPHGHVRPVPADDLVRLGPELVALVHRRVPGNHAATVAVHQQGLALVALYAGLEPQAGEEAGVVRAVAADGGGHALQVHREGAPRAGHQVAHLEVPHPAEEDPGALHGADELVHREEGRLL